MSISLRRRGAVAHRGGTGTFADAVWDATQPPTSTSWIQRVSADLYYLYQPLGGAEYVRNEMRRLTTAQMTGDDATSETYAPPLSLDATGAYLFAKSVVSTDASVVRFGTWTSNLHSSTPGDHSTWTTPANTVAISCTYTAQTNQGFAKVLIDGDPTRANQCDTAQQAVDGGTLPSASLVANGGTLNPTDRVMDWYVLRSAKYPQPLIADGLTPGVHTVRFEVTGYKRAASSAVRSLSPPTLYYVTADASPATAATTVLQGTRMFDGVSAQESAYNIRLSSVNQWMGGIHANYAKVSEVIKVDGSTVTMTDGQVLTALTDVVIDVVGTFHHTSNGPTKIGDVVRKYTLNGNGLRVEHSTTWAITVGMGAASYPAMLTMARKNTAGEYRWGEFSMASSDAIAGNISAAVVGSVETTLGEASTMWLWTPGGKYVGIGRMVDPATTLLGWVNAQPKKNFVWNNTGGLINKLYWTLKSLEDTMADVPSGTVWAADTTYRWAKVTDADAVCSRP